MRITIILLGICVFLAGGAIYMNMKMKIDMPTHTHPQTHKKVEQPLPIKDNQDAPSKPVPEQVTVEKRVIHKDVDEAEWLKDKPKDAPLPRGTDPFSDYLAKEKSEKDGTFIGDPETMDPEELRKAMFNQLIKRFGDIPAVHALIEYQRKYDGNIPMPLEEDIAGLEATQELFPSESNRKTLAFSKWMLSKGLVMRTDPFEMTPEDVIYLRSEGISIKQDIRPNGDIKTIISTQ